MEGQIEQAPREVLRDKQLLSRWWIRSARAVACIAHADPAPPRRRPRTRAPPPRPRPKNEQSTEQSNPGMRSPPAHLCCAAAGPGASRQSCAACWAAGRRRRGAARVARLGSVGAASRMVPRCAPPARARARAPGDGCPALHPLCSAAGGIARPCAARPAHRLVGGGGARAGGRAGCGASHASRSPLRDARPPRTASPRCRALRQTVTDAAYFRSPRRRGRARWSLRRCSCSSGAALPWSPSTRSCWGSMSSPHAHRLASLVRACAAVARPTRARSGARAARPCAAARSSRACVLGYCALSARTRLADHLVLPFIAVRSSRALASWSIRASVVFMGSMIDEKRRSLATEAALGVIPLWLASPRVGGGGH